MADTTFVSKVTHIVAAWLNDVNKAVYRAIGIGGVAPTTPAEVRSNLGLTAAGGAALVGNAPSGGVTTGTVQAAINELDTLKAPLDSPAFTTIASLDGDFIVGGQVWAQDKVTGIIPMPGGFGSTAGNFTREAYAANQLESVNAAMFVGSLVTTDCTSFEWNQLNVLNNYAPAGENVSFYSQGYKHAAGATWAGVFEVHDRTHVQPEQALYGLEVDISANGSDISSLGFSTRFGQQIVAYRDDGYLANFIGHISGNTLTVTGTEAGVIRLGMQITSPAVSAGTWITAFGSGIGLMGTYTINNAQTVASQNLMGYQPILTGYVGTGSDASVTAIIDDGAGFAGTILKVTGITRGIIAVGMKVSGNTIGVAPGTVITGLLTGSGGVGTYSVNNSQLVASTSMTLFAVANAVLTITHAYPDANNFGVIHNLVAVFGRGLPNGTTIASFGTGSGGVGTYNLTIPTNHWEGDTNTAVAPLQGFVFGGGAQNIVGNGVWIGGNNTDPGGNYFTNMINLSGDGDIGLTSNGYQQFGISMTGHYAYSPLQISTPSAPASIINLIGTQNSPALLSFGTKNGNAMYVSSAGVIGAVAGYINIVIDGTTTYCIPVHLKV